MTDSPQSEPEIEITPEMLAAGRAVFVSWFERDEHQEGLVELPSDASAEALLCASFASMLARMPDRRMN